MKDYMIFGIRTFLGIEEDLTTVLQNQEQMLEKLEGLEISAKEVVENTSDMKEKSYIEYITLNNIFWSLAIGGLIGTGAFLYFNMGGNGGDLGATEILNSIKNLGSLNQDLQMIQTRTFLESFKTMNENMGELSLEQLLKLNELLKYTRIIKSVVQPYPVDKFKNILTSSGSDDLGWN